MVEQIWIFEVGVADLFGLASQTKENLIICNFELHVGQVKVLNFLHDLYKNNIKHFTCSLIKSLFGISQLLEKIVKLCGAEIFGHL